MKCKNNTQKESNSKRLEHSLNKSRSPSTMAGLVVHVASPEISFDSQRLEHIRRYLVEYFPLSSPEN